MCTRMIGYQCEVKYTNPKYTSGQNFLGTKFHEKNFCNPRVTTKITNYFATKVWSHTVSSSWSSYHPVVEFQRYNGSISIKV